jgi:hypothetical protein
MQNFDLVGANMKAITFPSSAKSQTSLDGISRRCCLPVSEPHPIRRVDPNGGIAPILSMSWHDLVS